MNNTQQNKSINKGRPVYFSYARNSIRKPEWEHISDCVTKMLDIFSEQNIEYRVDVRNIGSGDKISDFENGNTRYLRQILPLVALYVRICTNKTGSKKAPRKTTYMHQKR